MKDAQTSNYKMSDDPILRSCAIYALVYFGSLFLGGYWILTIILGLSLIARHILFRLTGVALQRSSQNQAVLSIIGVRLSALT